AADQEVLAGAAGEGVVAAAADKDVPAAAGDQQVVAVAAGEHVAAEAAEEDVVAAAAEGQRCSRSGDQEVNAVPALQRRRADELNCVEHVVVGGAVKDDPVDTGRRARQRQLAVDVDLNVRAGGFDLQQVGPVVVGRAADVERAGNEVEIGAGLL